VFSNSHPDIGLLRKQMIKENTRHKQKLQKALVKLFKNYNCVLQKDENEKSFFNRLQF
jgi:hypothetical protein